MPDEAAGYDAEDCQRQQRRIGLHYYLTVRGKDCKGEKTELCEKRRIPDLARCLGCAAFAEFCGRF